MTQIPGFVREQDEQRDRDRQHAIDIAVRRLEDGEANFKLDIMAINGMDARIRARDQNRVSADPTVAQYA